jgi:hypothetical protein
MEVTLKFSSAVAAMVRQILEAQFSCDAFMTARAGRVKTLHASSSSVRTGCGVNKIKYFDRSP